MRTIKRLQITRKLYAEHRASKLSKIVVTPIVVIFLIMFGFLDAFRFVKRHMLLAMVLVTILVLSGCCSTGGLQGAIDYQVNGCEDSAITFGGYGGYYYAQPVEVEIDPQLLFEIRKQTTAQTQAAQALQRANFCATTPNGC